MRVHAYEFCVEFESIETAPAYLSFLPFRVLMWRTERDRSGFQLHPAANPAYGPRVGICEGPKLDPLAEDGKT